MKLYKLQVKKKNNRFLVSAKSCFRWTTQKKNPQQNVLVTIKILSKWVARMKDGSRLGFWSVFETEESFVK